MGKTAEAQGLSDAARGRAAGGVALRLPLRAFLASESGATAVEYGLIVACIFLAIIGGVSLFAGNENAMYTTIGAAVGGAVR